MVTGVIEPTTGLASIAQAQSASAPASGTTPAATPPAPSSSALYSLDIVGSLKVPPPAPSLAPMTPPASGPVQATPTTPLALGEVPSVGALFRNNASGEFQPAKEASGKSAQLEERLKDVGGAIVLERRQSGVAREKGVELKFAKRTQSLAEHDFGLATNAAIVARRGGSTSGRRPDESPSRRSGARTAARGANPGEPVLDLFAERGGCGVSVGRSQFEAEPVSGSCHRAQRGVHQCVQLS